MKHSQRLLSAMWHCVLDQQMRLVYLGQDIAVARELAVDDTVLCSAETMGDAMKAAAIAWGVDRRRS